MSANNETVKSTSTYADGDKVPQKWYQGRSGKTSAKRVAGVCLVVTGIIVSILSVIFSYTEPEEILWPILSAGTLLLGAGVLERFGSTGGNEK